MVNRFADIVQKACTFGKVNVHTKFRSHNCCQMGNFNRMVKNVLAVTCTVFQTSQKFNHFRMQTVHPNREHSLFTGFFNSLFNFFLCFLYHFFNAGRMNTPVIDEFFKSYTCNFTPYRVKPRNNNRFRSIVYNKIYACQCFQSSDVSALAADNAAFHFIIRQCYNRNSGFGNMVCGTALNHL